MFRISLLFFALEFMELINVAFESFKCQKCLRTITLCGILMRIQDKNQNSLTTFARSHVYSPSSIVQRLNEDSEQKIKNAHV